MNKVLRILFGAAIIAALTMIIIGCVLGVFALAGWMM